MNKYFFGLSSFCCMLIVFMSLFTSCQNLYGPKPDKSIEMVLEFDTSTMQFDTIIKRLNNRFHKIARDYEVTKGKKDNQLKVLIDTHYPVERIKKYIVNPIALNFYETYNQQDVYPFLNNVDVVERAQKSEILEGISFFDLIKPSKYSAGAMLFMVAEKDTALVHSYMLLVKEHPYLKKNTKNLKFLWGIKDTKTDLFPLYALKSDHFGNPSLSGNLIKDASASYNNLSNPVVRFQMNYEGAQKWEYLTGRAFRNASQIAILLDNQVHSAPAVTQGPIAGGASEVTGEFSFDEAVDLANMLASGPLPKIKILSIEVRKIE